jgi:ribosomal protein S12 methylthiotransferase
MCKIEERVSMGISPQKSRKEGARSDPGRGARSKRLSIVGDEATSRRPYISPKKSSSFAGTVGVVTLGCAKNQVDAEVMLGVLKSRGYTLVSDLSLADVAVINTCGFLQSAIDESLRTIKEVATLKTHGRLRKLVVAGCLVEREREELKKTLPEADAFLTTQELLSVGEVVERAGVDDYIHPLEEGGRPYFLYDETTPRILSTQPHTSFVKVSEGCNRPCSFCIIPQLRGSLRSRSIESVVREVRSLVEHGVKEISLVAQDLTAFGSERKDVHESLPLLIKALCEETGISWIRLHYAYPLGITSELLDTFNQYHQLCPYLDIPLQHSSEYVLKAMKRPLGKYSPRALVQAIRSKAPHVHVRTTFIVGFPGEKMEDVEDLCSFVSEGWFTHVGVFAYSREKGTSSYDLDNHLSEGEKKRRRGLVMTAQKHVIEKRLASLVGTRHRILLEGVHPESAHLLVGRTSFQSLEVDGNVLVNHIEKDVLPTTGTFYDAVVTGVSGYDLVATLAG